MEKSYEHLNCTEKALIQVELKHGTSLRSIARSLNRSVSTVSRELRRNGCPPSCRTGRRGRRPVAGSYRALLAEKCVRHMLHQPRKPKRMVPGEALWDAVVSLLQAGNSPEQVSATLKRMHPEDSQFRISHETIYTVIYAMPQLLERWWSGLVCLSRWPKSTTPEPRQLKKGSVSFSTGLMPNGA